MDWYDLLVPLMLCPLAYFTCCCCNEVSIVIHNSNSARDDNFDVYLNNQFLGAINLDAHEPRAYVFYTGYDPVFDSQIFDDQPELNPAYTQHLLFPKSILYTDGTSNQLEMRNTESNYNGNFGSVKVHCRFFDGDPANPQSGGWESEDEKLLDTVYNMPDGSSAAYYFQSLEGISE